MAACQRVSLTGLIEELMIMKTNPMKIYIDTKSAVKLAENPTVHKRSKHICVCNYYVRSCVADKIWW